MGHRGGTRLPRIGRLAGLAVVTAIAITGCSGTNAIEPTDTATPAPTTAAPAFPLTVTNCGVREVFAAPPKRVVTIKSSTLELMLALGLGERVIGSAFSDGPVPGVMAAAAAKIPVLSEKVPSQEAVLAAAPDLVFAGWESNLTAQGAGDRSTLQQLGVASYIAPSACKSRGYMPDPLTFDTVFDEITEAGAIFGVPDAAAALVAEQRAALAKVVPDASDRTAIWYSSGVATPYVGGGIGAPAMIMKAAGLKNLAANVHDTWTSLSWELVAAANPDVIVLVDASWNTAASKQAFLESNPVTSQMTAVKNKRYLVVEFPASEAGVRNVAAVESLVAQLAKLQK
ncbi:MAG TPA: putative F420-0 ABC transporter substrate-binding protein [Candidatus Lumbricidophila sp.]|nr:putative F420-0 ABC transporter substrate-binding protein [Candidatus Lumbricidophila sp.]